MVVRDWLYIMGYICVTFKGVSQWDWLKISHVELVELYYVTSWCDLYACNELNTVVN